MPTTLDIDPDVLAAARELAGRRGVSIGRVLSELARQTLVSGSDAVVPREPAPSFCGFQSFPARRAVIDTTIDRLRDQDGA